MTTERAAFLVVEDDPLVARWLARAFDRFRTVDTVGTVAAGQALLTDPTRSWAALVTDYGLPDGSGLDLARFARDRHPTLPILVLTGTTVPKVVNGSFLLGASFLSKPTTQESLELFARKALAREAVEDTRVLDMIEVVSREWALSEREIELLTLSMADRPRGDLADALGVTENTAKTQVKSLLRKSGARNLDHLVRVVLKRALDRV